MSKRFLFVPTWEKVRVSPSASVAFTSMTKVCFSSTVTLVGNVVKAGASLASTTVTVTNVADYSSDSVAHLALTFILNFSCSMIPQQRMSWEGDRAVFSQE